MHALHPLYHISALPSFNSFVHAPMPSAPSQQSRNKAIGLTLLVQCGQPPWGASCCKDGPLSEGPTTSSSIMWSHNRFPPWSEKLSPKMIAKGYTSIILGTRPCCSHAAYYERQSPSLLISQTRPLIYLKRSTGDKWTKLTSFAMYYLVYSYPMQALSSWKNWAIALPATLRNEGPRRRRMRIHK